MHRILLEGSRELIRACACEDGCPACVGPAMEVGPGGKGHTLDLINGLLVMAGDARGNGAANAHGQGVTAGGDTLNVLTD
jgi:hypothetical protein